jgi:hypothetical protein
MKKYLYCLLLTLILALPALAVPEYINYQGLLRDDDGDLVTGTRSMTFGIYSSQTGVTALWTMTAPNVSINNGLYTVQLGPLTSSELGSGRRWLEVKIGDEILSPRLEILSVAYAVTADTATTALYAVSAESASKLQNYSPAVSGSGSFVPVTTSGKLSTSVIPTSGLLADTADYANVSGTATHAATADYATVSGTATNAASADNADYATVSGTATNAANADTVNNIHANTTATASNLYPLDGSGRLSGVPVSAEQGGDTFALDVNGRLNATYQAGAGTVGTPVNCVVGRATLDAASEPLTVYNNYVTSSSVIFLTPVRVGSTLEEPLKIISVSEGQFVVNSLDETVTQNVDFFYLVIN